MWGPKQWRSSQQLAGILADCASGTAVAVQDQQNVCEGLASSLRVVERQRDALAEALQAAEANNERLNQQVVRLVSLA